MAQAWHLMRRPKGMPVPDDFALKDVRAARARRRHGARRQPLAVGRSLYARPDERREKLCPAVRARCADGGRRDRRSGREPRPRASQPGDMVLHMGGWRDETVAPAAALNKLPPIPGVEPQAFLGNLGLTGGTAYFGLLEAASAKEGDIVFVSAAAGAVGSAVVQIAKAKGMTVIGSAGGADKCDFVRSLGRGCGDRLQGRAGAEAAGRGRAEGHRRLFRQCRRRSSRCGAGAGPQGRALRHLRHDRGL